MFFILDILSKSTIINQTFKYDKEISKPDI